MAIRLSALGRINSDIHSIHLKLEVKFGKHNCYELVQLWSRSNLEKYNVRRARQRTGECCDNIAGVLQHR